MIPKDQLAQNGGGLNPSDFLTGSEMAKTPFAPPRVPVQNTGLKSVEEEEIPLTAPQKIAINSDILAKEIDKEDVEEMFEREISSPKVQGIAETPEDIFKHIISRGEYSETVEIWNYKWTMKALNHGELISALDGMKDSLASQAGRVTALAFTQVLYAITAINGISIYEWFPKIKRSDYPDIASYKEAVRRGFKVYFAKFPPTLIDDLYEAYAKIEVKRKEALESLKNS
jgi:hypothetical protein